MASQQELQDSDESASPVEQRKTTARGLIRKVGAAIPHQSKRRWAALTATITATAGLVAGWAIRRDRPRKQFWPRRGR